MTDLRFVGALGETRKNSTPAYVEPVVVDRDINARMKLSRLKYVYFTPSPFEFEPSEIVMTPLPDFHADIGKNVLILSSEDVEDICSSWHDYHESNIFIDWLMGPHDTDMALGACSLSGGYVALLVKPERAKVILHHIGEVVSSYLRFARLSKQSVRNSVRIVQQTWRLQRAARGDLTFMARAGYVFGLDSTFQKNLMRRATEASDSEWEAAYANAEKYFRDE